MLQIRTVVLLTWLAAHAVRAVNECVANSGVCDAGGQSCGDPDDNVSGDWFCACTGNTVGKQERGLATCTLPQIPEPTVSQEDDDGLSDEAIAILIAIPVILLLLLGAYLWSRERDRATENERPVMGEPPPENKETSDALEDLRQLLKENEENAERRRFSEEFKRNRRREERRERRKERRKRRRKTPSATSSDDDTEFDASRTGLQRSSLRNSVAGPSLDGPPVVYHCTTCSAPITNPANDTCPLCRGKLEPALSLHRPYLASKTPDGPTTPPFQGMRTVTFAPSSQSSPVPAPQYSVTDHSPNDQSSPGSRGFVDQPDTPYGTGAEYSNNNGYSGYSSGARTVAVAPRSPDASPVRHPLVYPSSTANPIWAGDDFGQAFPYGRQQPTLGYWEAANPTFRAPSPVMSYASPSHRSASPPPPGMPWGPVSPTSLPPRAANDTLPSAAFISPTRRPSRAGSFHGSIAPSLPGDEQRPLSPAFHVHTAPADNLPQLLPPGYTQSLDEFRTAFTRYANNVPYPDI
ncbi:hypothetical protein DIPPA_20711 [Diplonema papillatum]|nr:hypothetical protein DIPPA_20711 [Diplonema papillatum]